MRRIVLLVLALMTAGVMSAPAQDRISVTDAQLLATFNSPGDDVDPYWVITLQHFSTWRYGSNFFFIDIADSPGLDETFESDIGVYVEYAPVLSLRNLGLLKLEDSLLRDVGVTGQINTGWTGGGFPIDRVFLEGVELAWNVPTFAVFNTQLLARQERNWDPSWQVTWVYALPFNVGPTTGAVSGFMDVWRRSDDDTDTSYTVLVAQPQILFDLGSGDPGRSRLQIGVELEPSYNFPLKVENEIDGWNFAFSPMVRWIF